MVDFRMKKIDTRTTLTPTFQSQPLQQEELLVDKSLKKESLKVKHGESIEGSFQLDSNQ